MRLVKRIPVPYKPNAAHQLFIRSEILRAHAAKVRRTSNEKLSIRNGETILARTNGLKPNRPKQHRAIPEWNNWTVAIELGITKLNR